jgi:flagellar P-ring protein precursor FlgI
MRTMRRAVLAVLSVLACAASAGAQAAQPPSAPPSRAPEATFARAETATISIRDMVRLGGHGSSTLRGMGIVTGLRGTGDSGAEAVLARPLAQYYLNSGNPIPDLKELSKSKAAAIVFLWAEIPEEGGRKGDRFDIYVKVSHSASSLQGGMLDISPVLGPLPGQGVFGTASGHIRIEDTSIPTVGIIKDGLQLVEDIRMPELGKDFELVLRPGYRGWNSAAVLSQQINESIANLLDEGNAPPSIAKAVDEITVRVVIPPNERSDPANFVANILSKRISPDLLKLPAQVICNERTGVILATGNVEISPVAIAHKDLVVTTTTPPPTPTPADPVVQQDKWVGMGTAGRTSERARLQDLLDAFKQLDVPVREQISIITEMHKAGRLHARLVIE